MTPERGITNPMRTSLGAGPFTNALVMSVITSVCGTVTVSAPHTCSGRSRKVSVVDALITTQRLLVRQLDQRLAEFELNVEQWRVLRAIGSGALMGEISERLVASPATTTRLVDSLVDRGLLFRRASATDRRQVQVTLSHEGVEMLAVADAVVEGVESGLGERGVELVHLLSKTDQPTAR
jgi:DNA-binding MarR family transcriptional regulator